LVDGSDAGIHLLADGETLRTLLVAVARQVRALDEGVDVVVDQLHLDAAVLDTGDLAGDDRALAQFARGRRFADGVTTELLDAERDALLLDVHVENLRLHHVAAVVLLDRLLARTVPVQVGEVDHAVDIAVETYEQAELGLVLDLALDHGADRMVALEGFPRVLERLLEAERDAALDRVDLEHDHLDLLRGRQDLARMHVLLGPAHLGDVDEALDPRLELHEGAVVGDVGDGALDLLADRVLAADAFPRIALELLHAGRDAVGLLVDADDLHLDGLADRQDLGRVVDAPPRHVGDMQQAVDAAEVDERAVVGDVLDHALDDLALLEVMDDLRALLGPAFLEHGATRQDDVATAAIHLEDLEGLRVVHQRGDVADRPDVDLAARQEGHGAVEINGEAALDLVEDDAFAALTLVELLFELDPALLAARLLAGKHRFAERVLDAVDVDLDLVASLQLLGARSELLQRDAALDLEAD